MGSTTVASFHTPSQSGSSNFTNDSPSLTTTTLWYG